MMINIPIWESTIELELSRQDKCFIGMNGSGKTTLLNNLATYFDTMNIKYIRYDAIEALYEFDLYASITIEEQELFLKFLKQTIDADAIYNGIVSGLSQGSHIYDVLGNGHKRLLNMIIKSIRVEEPVFYLMDLPEASLSLTQTRRLIEYIKSTNPFVTCLIATHDPSIVTTVNRNQILSMHELIKN